MEKNPNENDKDHSIENNNESTGQTGIERDIDIHLPNNFNTVSRSVFTTQLPGIPSEDEDSQNDKDTLPEENVAASSLSLIKIHKIQISPPPIPDKLPLFELPPLNDIIFSRECISPVGMDNFNHGALYQVFKVNGEVNVIDETGF